jgi:3'-phosphoadenosine 5'-phosphosulfate sulfotransferase (PAPS reductase)/FAD synthetase
MRRELQTAAQKIAANYGNSLPTAQNAPRRTAAEQLANALPRRPLTILQCGVGVDSTGLLVRLFGLDQKPRIKLDFPIDAVFHEDTGAELLYTVEYRDWLRDKCTQLGIPFIVIETTDPAIAPSKHGPIDAAYLRQPKPGIPTRRPRSCTITRKVQPCSNLLNAHYDLRRGRWRTGDLIANVPPGTRHRVILGIAVDEAHRAKGQTKAIDPTREWIEVHYPMIEHNITRDLAASAIKAAGWPEAFKSGCFCCPFQPVSHYWAISQLWPDLYERALTMEQASRSHNPKLTLTGLPLEQAVAKWQKTHHPTDPWQIISTGYKQSAAWE